MSCKDEIEIDGVAYVRKASIPDPSDMVIVRTVNAGVHYGRIKESVLAEGRVVLQQSRRLWAWSGAASLSELSLSGVKSPSSCKFAVRLPEITVLGVIEVIPCSAEAVRVIEEVPEWKA